MTWNKATVTLAAVILLFMIGLQSATAQTENASTCKMITLNDGGQTNVIAWAFTSDEQSAIYTVRDGVSNESIYRVPVMGGETSVLYASELGSLAGYDPLVAPLTGGTLAFATWYEPNVSAIVTLATDGSQPPVLISLLPADDAARLIHIVNGWLQYQLVFSNQYMAVNLDTGETVALVPPGARVRYDILPSPTIYFYEGDLYRVESNGSFPTVLHNVDDPIRLDIPFGFSDDGSRILYSAFSGKQPDTLFSFSTPLIGGEPRLIARTTDFGSEFSTNVMFSPSGNGVVWSIPNAADGFGLYRYTNAADPAHSRLVFKAAMEHDDTYAPLFDFIDESTIWVTGAPTDASHAHNIYRIPLNGGQPIPMLAAPVDATAVWSDQLFDIPPGVTLFIAYNADGNGTMYRLVESELIPLFEEQFLSQAQFDFGGYYNPRLLVSGDGQRLIYRAFDGERFFLRSVSLTDASDTVTLVEQQNTGFREQEPPNIAVRRDGLGVLHQFSAVNGQFVGALYYSYCQ